mmetsp:Transcript_66545/g.177228  ORF Transcript_66545/g.177228 Transcript_66545/m.177228 type:complete len:208 (+) Transcript_66545:178-801(+)
MAARLGAAPGAEAASSASTAMGTPFVACSLPARRRAAARKAFFSGSGCASLPIASASPAGVTDSIGRWKAIAAPRTARESAFEGWSPKIGTAAMGTPKLRPSCMLLAPQCVRKAEHRRSTSICGTAVTALKLGGTGGKPSRTSSCGPRDSTTKGAPALLSPRASKHARKTCCVSCFPVQSCRPLDSPNWPKGRDQNIALEATVPSET